MDSIQGPTDDTYKMKQYEIQPTDMKINHFQFKMLMDNWKCVCFHLNGAGIKCNAVFGCFSRKIHCKSGVQGKYCICVATGHAQCNIERNKWKNEWATIKTFNVPWISIYSVEKRRLIIYSIMGINKYWAYNIYVRYFYLRIILKPLLGAPNSNRIGMFRYF